MSKTLNQPSPAPEIEPDQLAHDQWMAQQTPEQLDQMVKGLGDLARSRETSVPASSPSALPEPNPVISQLRKLGRPLTAENYLSLAYPDKEPTPELLAEAEEAIRQSSPKE